MTLTPAQRRARLGHRHLLVPAARAGTSEEVAHALLGLHATDSATVALSAYARLADPRLADLERALYEDGTLLRMHCMRRTLFAVPTTLVPVLHHSTTRKVAARERAGLLKLLATAEPPLDAAWLARAEEEALAVLRRLGEAGASEITDHAPLLQQKLVLAPGKRYQATQRAGGWVLRLLAMDGRVRRGRPLGGWTSGRFRYREAPPMPDADPEAARAEVVRRWLRSYGPGTTDDVKWWTGWTVTETRRALGAAGAVAVDLAEGPGWVLPDDLAEASGERTEGEDWVALLPGLDPTTMGWRHRDWYLDPAHRAGLFDTNGNAGPTVWRNGEIIGGWACRPDGEIVWRLLTDRGAAARVAVAAEAARLQEWLGENRFAPAFPTPLATELVRGERG
ncbi:winged helix DNA-binding domain-containing protein [Streptomyces sp. JJ36]|uniref:winged helix DNA-binding domain-containing protein n=1 Tax=Streptomyces sp. JJ36 TaxID=2736645 RepID=UPI001F27DC17|nr:winged helix DNA-binding domain-containing protein [Streptomyces sp. JJ36]MCF6522319.1 AlkZ family DNA glycosylase [Streptomyces sp. JJ36]